MKSSDVVKALAAIMKAEDCLREAKNNVIANLLKDNDLDFIMKLLKRAKRHSAAALAAMKEVAIKAATATQAG